MRATRLPALAWRNLWRQKRRTLLTLVAIAFGGFLAVLMTAMMDRSFADFIDTAARLGAGHVTIQHPEYADTPTLSRTVEEAPEKREVAAGDPKVDVAVERASGQAMLATATDSFGAMFIAYDPAMETEETFQLGEALTAGRMFESASDDGIILGKKLAANLGAELGDKVVFTMTDSQGEIITGMERLSGIVATGAPSLDSGLALLPIDRVRELVGYDPDETTQVAVFLSDSRRSLQVAHRLDPRIDDAAVLTWDQLQPEIRSFIAMKVGGSRVMEILIGILVAAGIFNTLFVSVMERLREFGIMRAIGWSPGRLFGLVMWESTWLGLTGLATGAAITAPIYWYLHENGIDMTEMYATGDAPLEVAGVGFDMVLRIGIFPEHALFIAAAIVVATMAAGVYPAWKAGRVNPVETINLV